MDHDPDENQDIWEAMLTDEITPLERGLQTLRVWFQVIETEYGLGDREGVEGAREVIERACREVSALMPPEGQEAENAAQHLAQAQTVLERFRT